MSESAKSIYEHAPLGALIAFSNGEPRPPERFNKKLSKWKISNATGLLTEKSLRGADAQPHFVLLEAKGIYEDCSTIKFSRVYRLETELELKVIDVPKPGDILCLTTFGGREALQSIARNQAEADAWLARNQHSHTKLVHVGADQQLEAA